MDFRLPEIGEGVYEAEFVAWLVKVGDSVQRGQNLMEVLTDKATMEVPSSFTGKITSLKLEEGQQVKVGDVVLTYEAVGAVSPPAPEKADPKAGQVAAGAGTTSPPEPVRGGNGVSRGRAKAAPSVRLMARQLGVDLHRVTGSGPDGRILVEDLSRHVGGAVSPADRPAAPRPDYGKAGTTVKLVGLRRKIAEQMVKSKTTIPHYAYIDECDASELVRLRESLKTAAAQRGVKLTYLAFLVKAVVSALQQVPIVNATLDDAAGEIVLHARYDIGVAVATPQGLIVPVVRDVDKKDLFTVAREVERLGEAARQGRTRLEDLRGGTFTVTSVGNIGGLISTPVINHPEVGIMGVGKIVKRPVYDEHDNVVPAHMLYLSFSFDHRVVDGAIGAAFGNAVKEVLQKPAVLLLPASG